MKPSVAIQAFADAMRPPSRLPPSEWCRKFVHLPHSERGRFDLSASPWLREPLDAVGDTENTDLDFLFPTGAGKTTLYEGIIHWAIAESPGPMMYYELSDDDASIWSESRLMPSLKLCEPIAPLWPTDRHKKRKTEIMFPHMALLIGGASMSNAQAKSLRRVMMDECWDYRPGMMREILARLHDRWNRQAICGSQGGIVGGDWHGRWTQSTMEEFSWLCECGERQPYDHHSLKWEDEGKPYPEYDKTLVEKTTRVICRKCAKEHADDPRVRRALSESAVYVPTNESPSKGHRGFHASAMALFHIPWSRLVHEYKEAQSRMQRGDDTLMRAFKMKRLATFWSDEITDNRAELMGADYSYDEHSSGQPWPGEAYRFVTVDRQQDHFWLGVRAWKADGSSRLLFYGKILTWEMVEEIRESFNVPKSQTFIDAQFQTPAVYAACAKYGWTALHGSQEQGFAHKVRGIRVRKFFSPVQIAQVAAGGLRYVFWSNRRVKDVLVNLRNGKGVPWEYPPDAPKTWQDQIDSEVCREVVNKSSGQIEMRWIKVKRDNHSWDVECMQVAAAMMAKILGDGSETIGENDNDKEHG